MTMLDGYDLSDDATELALYAENHGPLYADRIRTIKQIAARQALLGQYDVDYARERWNTWLQKARDAYRRTERAPNFFRAMDPADRLPNLHEWEELVNFWEEAERAEMRSGEHAWMAA